MYLYCHSFDQYTEKMQTAIILLLLFICFGINGLAAYVLFCAAVNFFA